MRILFVIKCVELAGGGAERVLSQVASELASRGHDVLVATFGRSASKPFYPYYGVTLTALDRGHVERPTTVAELFSRAVALRRHARATKPDVAVGFMHSAFVPLSLALAGIKIPTVASEHISYDYYAAHPIERAIFRATASLNRAITAISPKIRRGFPTHIRRRMVVIPNPVAVMPLPKRSLRDGDRRVILSVGRLDEQKNHKTLVASFGKLAARFPQWDLRIVGEGRLKEQLERQVAELGLGGRVSLPGVIHRISDEYEAADLFVMPSTYESFGLVTAEAMETGLPVIGFADCPGTNEIISHEVDGLLVDGADRVGALADAMARLMDDDALRLRLGAVGPASVTRYSLPSVVDAWEQLLESIVRP